MPRLVSGWRVRSVPVFLMCLRGACAEMLRTKLLALIVVCSMVLAGCKALDEQKKKIASLEDKLLTCAQQRDDLQKQRDLLESDYLSQGEALKAAQAKERELNDLLSTIDAAKQEREKKLEELRKLVQNISGMTVESRPEGDFIVIESEILFASGKIDLSEQARKTLDDTVVAYLKKNLKDQPDQEIRIDGHTDGVPITRSDWLSNHHLAAMRAHAVMTYLVSKGIPVANMYVVGFGPNRPRVQPPRPEADVAQNRRVEILLVPKTGRAVEEILEKFRK